MAGSRVLNLFILVGWGLGLVVAGGPDIARARNDNGPAMVTETRAPEAGPGEMKKEAQRQAACRNCAKACCRSRVACNKKECRCAGKEEKVE